MSADVRLQVGPYIYSGWTSIQISKRIDAISGAFYLNMTDNLTRDLGSWPINVGDKCVVSIRGKPLISGHIDDLTVRYDSERHSVEVSGRDNTGDLVDCSVVSESDEYLNQPLLAIAQSLCEPFGIPVFSEISDTSIFDVFKIDPGESPFHTLEKASRKRGVLFLPDGLGNLKLARIGATRTHSELIEGWNILSASARYSMSERFSEYLVRGQELFRGDTEEQANIEGKSLDYGIKRYRPKLVIAQGAVSSAEAQTLAGWEASVRAARAIVVDIETQGWLKENGSLWAVNELVRLRSPRLGIDADMLITGVDFTLSQDMGSRTHLELTRKDAFLPQPEIHGEAI